MIKRGDYKERFAEEEQKREEERMRNLDDAEVQTAFLVKTVDELRAEMKEIHEVTKSFEKYYEEQIDILKY